MNFKKIIILSLLAWVPVVIYKLMELILNTGLYVLFYEAFWILHTISIFLWLTIIISIVVAVINIIKLIKWFYIKKDFLWLPSSLVLLNLLSIVASGILFFEFLFAYI